MFWDFVKIRLECGAIYPVKTRGPLRPPRLFSPLLYQLSYLAELCSRRT
jgi:hypothetical protein